MAAGAPEARPRRTLRRPLGCLAALLVVGSLIAYMFVSVDILPRRAFERAHSQLRPGLPLHEAAEVLLRLMESRGLFQVSQLSPEGERQVLLSRSQAPSERPSAEALAARVDRHLPIDVWMSTFNLSGQFVILLDADGTVREVSKIDGHIK